MGTRQNRNKEKLLEELRRMPLVEFACKRTGIARSTYYRWRKEDLMFQAAANEAINDGTDVVNDLAESRVISGINNGDQKYVFFWLNNRHSKYYLQRAPHPPSDINLLEAKLKIEIEKFQQLIKDFLDSPDNLPDDRSKPKNDA